MMNDSQKAALSGLPKAALVDFIAEVHGLDKTLDKKIERLLLQADKPKLIKKLKTTIKGLERRRKFIDYWGSREFALELEYLKRDVMSLHQTHPEACLELIEMFMKTTDNSMERCDDSDGEVGEVYRSLSSSWLALATTCYEQEKEKIHPDETDYLSQFWQDRVKEVMEDDGYGLKNEILLNINQLLDKHEIKLMIEDYEQKYDDLLAEANQVKSQQPETSDDISRVMKNKFFTRFYKIDFEHQKKYDFKISKFARNLEGLAQALGDVDLFERLYFKHRPKRPLNPHLLRDLLNFMIQHNAFDLALGYLKEEWQSNSKADDLDRLDWLAIIYGKQGHIVKQLQTLSEAFETEPTAQRLKDIFAISTPAQQAKWRKRAVELAQSQEDVIMAIELLVELGEIKLANTTAVNRAAEFAGIHYYTLTELIETLPENTELIQVISYRSLLDDILNSGRSKVYNIAAQYFKKLYQLDERMHKLGLSYKGIQPHVIYINELRDRHGKKRSFWERVTD